MNYLATHLGERLGAKSYQLHAPAFVDTKEHCDALRSMGPVKEILDIARHANIALLGVGTVDPEVLAFRPVYGPVRRGFETNRRRVAVGWEKSSLCV